MDTSKLRLRAEKSLRANFVETEKGIFLTAGTHHFKTLWTRDFCFSIPGLLSLGEIEMVERQLGLILANQRGDGLLPRGIDVISPKLRVLHGLYLQRLTGQPITYHQKPLIAEFRGEHGTIAMDSNLLTILGALQVTKLTRSSRFWEKHLPQFQRALHFYDSYWKAGLLAQPAFSDWQDSLKREGSQLYTHLLLRKVMLLLGELQLKLDLQITLEELESKIQKCFLDRELWKNQSFESILWLIQDPIKSFQISPADFLQEFPASTWGLPSHHAPLTEVSWTTKVVGLADYHRKLHWSWLVAETATAAHRVSREISIQALQILDEWSTETNEIAEIYKNGSPYSSLLYRSEQPFAWGAAKTLEAISVVSI